MSNNEKIKDLLVKNGISTAGFNKQVVSGISFVRKISSEVKWTDGAIEDFYSKDSIKHYSILSELGEVWQKNWNLNAEDIPFTLILSELKYFLENCLSQVDFTPSYIEWTWDGNKFYLLKIKLNPDYTWRRLLLDLNKVEISEFKQISLENYQDINSTITKLLEKINIEFKLFNEPIFTEYSRRIYLNLDLIYSIYFYLGITGKTLNKLNEKFPVLKFKLSKKLLQTSERKKIKKNISLILQRENNILSRGILNLINKLIEGENIPIKKEITEEEILISKSGINI